MSSIAPDCPRTATVVITTKNRRDDLRRALISCFQQDMELEILVLDDGSTDGTGEMVQTEFPRARLERRLESKGLVVRRNEAARLARGDLIISIDDDAEFSAPGIIRSTIAEFSFPLIAVVAMPYIDVNRSDKSLKQLAPDPGLWMTSHYIGTAHAIRRELFNRLGGYREELFHQGEESDFCIRLLEAGYRIRLGRAAPILHHESPRRDFSRINIYGQRNQMLFAWCYVPGWRLPIYLAGTVLNGIVWGLRTGVLRYRLSGTWRGLQIIREKWTSRHPIRLTTYRLYRKLKKHGPLPLDLENAPSPEQSPG